MTEAEWLTCTDPMPMLGHLEGRLSERKRRLFECACCRRVSHFFRDGRSHRAVEVAERFADARANQPELEAASTAAERAWAHEIGDLFRHCAASAAYNVTIPLGWWGAAPAFVAPHEITREAAGNGEVEAKAQSHLARDIFGNPFRPASINPSCLTSGVVSLAQAIYDERASERMPELADALERAGCTNADILEHCRGPGPHVRGCWVVDLVLGMA